jgi:phospholipid/cholesterol/gamma-HCH transport system substrate-binding protein
MEGMQNTVKVGLVVILALVLAIGAYVVLNEVTFRGRTYTIQATFADGLGISKGQAVKLSGKDIGVVRNTALDDEGRFVATVIVDQGVLLYTDDMLVVSQQGLLGETFIAVKRQAEHAEDVRIAKEGDMLEGKSQTGLNELMADADKVLKQLHNVLDPDAVDNTMSQLTTGLKDTLDNVNSLLLTISGVVESNEGYVSGSLANVHEMSKNFLAISERLEITSEELAAVLNDPEQHDRFENVLANLEDISNNLSELTTEVNDLVGDPVLQQDLKDSVRLTKETLEEAKGTMVQFQETLGHADDVLDGAESLMSTTEGTITEAKGKLDQLQHIGDAVEIKLGLNVRAVDMDDDQALGNDDIYVGDLNAAVGYEDTYVYIGADDIGEETNFNLMMGYGGLAGLSFRGGVYRGELGLGAAYYGDYSAEVMLYDTEDPKVNAYGYFPVADQVSLVLGGEDLGNNPVASIGVGFELE